MNPWMLLGGAIMMALVAFGGYEFGHSTATTYEKAECAKAAKVVEDQVTVARNQSDAEKKTLQDYVNLLGKNYVAIQATDAKKSKALTDRTEAHVDQNPIATDHRCDLPAELLRDINDAGGNTEGREGESGGVVDAAVPVAAPHPH